MSFMEVMCYGLYDSMVLGSCSCQTIRGVIQLAITL